MITITSNHRLTKQRKLILDVVRSACYHPTADQVYRLTNKRMPSISVGTVYRNLDVLVEQKLIKRIDIPGEAARFDSDVHSKAYFVCRDRNVIYDLPVSSDSLDKLVTDNPIIDKVDGYNVVLFGKSKADVEIKSRKGLITIKN